MGGLTMFTDGVQNLIEKGYRKITPFFITYAITNMGYAFLGMDIGFMGANYSISTACATSNYYFFAAANHIRRGEADIMVAGGTEAAVIPIGFGGFVAYRALPQRNVDPKTASIGLGTRNMMVLSWVKELEYWYDLVTLIWPFIFCKCFEVPMNEKADMIFSGQLHKCSCHLHPCW
jgi:3-oxoacyl-(acyl-carrier-protein) synthase